MRRLLIGLALLGLSPLAWAICPSNAVRTAEFVIYDTWNCTFQCQQLLVLGGMCDYIEGTSFPTIITGGDLEIVEQYADFYPPRYRGTLWLDNGTGMRINSLSTHNNNLWTSGSITVNYEMTVPVRVK